MNELSIICSASSIASNMTTMLVTLERSYDTHTIRKAGNKLIYAIQTISNGRKLVDFMDLRDRDLQRAEALLDAFTVVARDDIIKLLR